MFSESSELSVCDLTPNVLGPLEGFTEMGFKVLAGAGFDESRHMTWRIQNPQCAVFDGSLKTVIDDFNLGRLVAPSWPPEGSALVALVAGENSTFRLSAENTKMPSKESFFAPLDIVESVAASEINPDFTVLQMSPAVLHPSALGRFSATISQLL
ncbi:hypothetical protein CkaCkLH20_06101 [Colletotrichum karsti]|uniref:Uncharacterized protein n=1 Tax=Colletotrichum karsti TaxID=1095194 RepID=A0A9P6I2L3_9PEZI|nr:uncharacterized protein CkaCkLH20_06101 [Colletotrichum karsti]KAF9876158.1 hypothetical protein CkaCkLH20_06101 [Colletotrichum karsti]